MKTNANAAKMRKASPSAFMSVLDQPEGFDVPNFYGTNMQGFMLRVSTGAGVHADLPELQECDESSDEEEDDEGEEVESLQGAVFLQGGPVVTPRAEVYMAGRNHVLLDNCASTPIFCNRDLVTNIKMLPFPVSMSGIAGTAELVIEQCAKYRGIDVLFDPHAATNVLAYAALAKKLKEEGGSIQHEWESGRYTVTWPDDSVSTYETNKDNLCALVPSHEKSRMLRKAKRANKQKQPNAHTTHTVCSIGLDENTRDVKKSHFKEAAAAYATAEDVKASLSAQERRGVELARELMEKLGFPSERDVLDLLRTGGIINAQVTAKDVKNAVMVYGRGGHEATQIGKMTRSKPQVHLEHESAVVSAREQILVADILYSDKFPFLFAISRPMGYLTCKYLERENGSSVGTGLVDFVKYYQVHGYRVPAVEFDTQAAASMINHAVAATGTRMTVMPPGVHASAAERAARTIKERVRAMEASLPFPLFGKLLIYAVIDACRTLNLFRSSASEAGSPSPREMMTGVKTDASKLVAFGSYALVLNEGLSELQWKTKAPRALQAIVIGCKDDKAGTKVLFNLATGQVVERQKVQIAPMPANVVAYIHEQHMRSASKLNKSLLPPMFSTKRGVIADVQQAPARNLETMRQQAVVLRPRAEAAAHEPFQVVQKATPKAASLAPACEPLSELTANGDIVSSPMPMQRADGGEETQAAAVAAEAVQDPPLESASSHVTPKKSKAKAKQIVQRALEIDNTVVLPPPAEAYGPPAVEGRPTTTSRSGRVRHAPPSKEVEIGPQHLTKSLAQAERAEASSRKEAARREEREAALVVQRAELVSELEEQASEMCLAVQSRSPPPALSTKNALLAKGPQGDASREAIESELKQLVKTKRAIVPIHERDLKQSERKKIIYSIGLLKNKYDPDGNFVKTKGRIVGDGSRQAEELLDAISSQTAQTTSVFILFAIAAAMRCHVSTVDVTGAYLNAEVGNDKEGDRHVTRLPSYLVDVLVDMYPELEEFRCGNGTMLFHIQKALYGMKQSGRLWQDHLTATLSKPPCSMVKNGYDHCVLNSAGGGERITLCCHVDDVFSFCKEAEGNERLVAQLEASYPGVSCARGPEIDYLGMHASFDKRTGVCTVSMKGYIDSLLEGVSARATSPATEHLFSVRECQLLSDSERKWFHMRVAKFLYLAKRIRPDLLVAVSFLSTRVQAPDVDDMAKLFRLTAYTNATRDRCLELSADLEQLRLDCSIDASFGTHADRRSHTGMTLSLGKGVVMASSRKNPGVQMSACEAELIGLSERASICVWARKFMIAQGYRMLPATIRQDNRSTIALVTNGRSQSERTRHIDIRAFWLKELIDSGEVELVWTPTEEMLADVLSKPLNGSRFVTLRDRLLSGV